MNTSFLLVSMFCVGVIVIAATVALVIILRRDRRNQRARVTTSIQNRWVRMLPYLGIAFLLAFWSFWISLLFLFVTWILHTNPSKEASYEVGENVKKTAKRVYNWLFWSPIITIPMFISMVDQLSWKNSSTNERVFAALVPLILHTVLLLGLTSKSVFVYRHSQQGMLLMALRATIAAAAVSMWRYPDDGIWLFLLGNGSLWLFGTIWGRNQVIRGKCWWMARKGELVVVLSNEADSKLESPTSSKLSPEMNIKQSKLFSKQNQNRVAIEHALRAFRAGSPEIKKQAVNLLASLGEVEQF